MKTEFRKSIAILFLGIIASLLIRSFFIFYGSDSADITKLREMGEAVLSGVNPYQVISYNIYPPLALYLEALTVLIANFLNIPFFIVTKFWPNLADILISLVIYKYLIKQKEKPIAASVWSLVYVLNPIAIITSSAHGQIDSIVSVLVLITIYLFLNYQKGFLYLGGIVLGMAIAIKPNPLMLVPFFLFYPQKEIAKKIFRKTIFLVLTTSIVIILLLPYIIGNNTNVLTNLLSYSGVYDIGLAAILRGLIYQSNASIWLDNAELILQSSKISFFFGFIFLFTIFAGTKNLAKMCLVIYLLFLSIFFGISAQYICWTLPLAIILRDKFIFAYTITGLIALLGFYLFFGPEILLGDFGRNLVGRGKFMPLYFYGNGIFWFTVIYWIVSLIKKSLDINYSKFSKTRQNMIKGSFLLFLVSFIPFVKNILDLLT